MSDTYFNCEHWYQVPILTILINNKEYNMLLDTGSNTSSLDVEIMNTIKDKKRTGVMSEMNTPLGNIDTDFGVYKIKFSCAGVEMTEDFASEDMMRTFAFFEKKTGIKLAGIIGADILLNHQAILDFKQQIIYFE